MSESVRTAFGLFLEIYELDCRLSGDTEKGLYVDLLHRIAELPWESRAKYSPLGALLPYVGTDKVTVVLWDVHQFKPYVTVTFYYDCHQLLCLAVCISFYLYAHLSI